MEQTKKKSKLKIIIPIIIAIVSIATIVIIVIKNRKDYLNEVEKFKKALINEGYQQREGKDESKKYYLGYGWNYDIDDEENIRKVSTNVDGVVYYYTVGPCNYYCINPYTGEISQFSHNYRSDNLTKWEPEETSRNYEYNFSLEYNPLQKEFSGYYAVYYNETLMTNMKFTCDIVANKINADTYGTSPSKQDIGNAITKARYDILYNIIEKYDIDLNKIYK